MRLSDLHRQLGELVDAGYGDRLVIDRSGNDVTEVYPPRDMPGLGIPLTDESAAVLLGSHIDCDLRREMGTL